MPAENVCYSLNDEDFAYTDIFSLMSAMDESGVLEAGAEYWESDFRVALPKDAFSVERILEGADEQLFDDVGEIYENDFSYASPAAKLELQELLHSWCDKHINLSSYSVLIGKSRKKAITAKEVADYRAVYPAEGAPA
ncbi:hypothetical protein NNO07_18800 [Pseudomonas resinovorans]|uniref:Uncharacterized protein n=1 Tax=Metapseudomonas resinovorans TaxID=53412 RepID=A0ABT4Y8B2_METRE|nr:hypothetical protein [Pseudomonas resinovorans]MDA8485120.1 hypothetical protein [Pseudomonas resinovorans]